MERDPRTGVSSGPLLALYQVENDSTWRDDGSALALGAKTPPPPDTSFSIFVPADPDVETVPASGLPTASAVTFASASWARGLVPGGKQP